MIGLKSYQDIKTPEEIDEDRRYESILNSLLEDYDPDEGDYRAYRQWAMKEARLRAAETEMEEENAAIPIR